MMLPNINPGGLTSLKLNLQKLPLNVPEIKFSANQGIPRPEMVAKPFLQKNLMETKRILSQELIQFDADGSSLRTVEAKKSKSKKLRSNTLVIPVKSEE